MHFIEQMLSLGLFSLSCSLNLSCRSTNVSASQNPKTLITKRKKCSNRRNGGNDTSMIQEEMYSRIHSFFGDESFAMIQNSCVIVVGLGGVGSHAAMMLVRSGIRRIRLIDFDRVTLSSLNRHSMATLDDVGKSKAAVLKERLLEVAPWCHIEAVEQMFKGSEADTLLDSTSLASSYPNLKENKTFVLDCIDDVNTKAELIAYCCNSGISILTSMGAGAKADPTRMRIASLSECINDPLASKIKWKLKKHKINPENVLSVFSIEKPNVELLPLDEEQSSNPQDYGTVDYLRLRVIPVLGTSPAIFGQSMACKVLCMLADKDFNGEVCERMSKSLKQKQKQALRAMEQKRGNYSIDEYLSIDDEDVEFVISQVWGNRCAITNKRFGGHDTLQLIRWRRDELPHPGNLVLISKSNAMKVLTEENAPVDAKIPQPHELALEKAHCVTPIQKEQFRQELIAKAISLPENVSATPQCFDQALLDKIEQRLQWANNVIGESSSVQSGWRVKTAASWHGAGIMTLVLAAYCFGRYARVD